MVEFLPMPLFFSILGLGFILGIRHAVDADHVVAVATIISKHKKIYHSSLIGIIWGIGHSITVTIVAIPVILFSFTIPTKIGLWLEFLVGIMLAVLGLLNLTGAARKISEHFLPYPHIHKHEDETGNTHGHIHFHFRQNIKAKSHHLGVPEILRPFIIGLVHGLAGSSAIALLILSTIKNTNEAFTYLFLFHAGVISSMMLITTFLGVSLSTIKKSESIHKYLILISGILSFIFGLFIVYRVGVIEGLFLP